MCRGLEFLDVRVWGAVFCCHVLSLGAVFGAARQKEVLEFRCRLEGCLWQTDRLSQLVDPRGFVLDSRIFAIGIS